ncbi:hypothetical protein SF23_06110 [Streptomyces sp. MBRL 10]|nr:hypothetical protein SF23_06110 [Streptomyces sp. MBRL 10]
MWRKAGIEQPMIMPRRTRPRRASANSAAVCVMASKVARAFFARGRTASPAAVRRIRRPERSSSCWPSSDSSLATWVLMPDWLTCSRRAAAVKVPSSTIAAK